MKKKLFSRQRPIFFLLFKVPRKIPIYNFCYIQHNIKSFMSILMHQYRCHRIISIECIVTTVLKSTLSFNFMCCLNNEKRIAICICGQKKLQFSSSSDIYTTKDMFSRRIFVDVCIEII